MRCTYFFLMLLVEILAGTSACSQPGKPPVVVAADSTADSVKIPELIIAAGTALLGAPYAYNTLDTGKEERLVVNLKAFDCVTFVETVLATALSEGDTSAFRDQLRQCRYRDGQINGYASRLHYLSDWLYEGERYGRLQIMTDSTNGILLPKPVNYMSAHRASYPRLADETTFKTIISAEKQINQRKMYYIPKNRIADIEKVVQEGDIIAITSKIKGLDTAHCGFAIRQGGQIHLLHASSEHHRVMISAEPLTAYLQRNPAQSGVIVARVKER